MAYLLTEKLDKQALRGELWSECTAAVSIVIQGVKSPFFMAHLLNFFCYDLAL